MLLYDGFRSVDTSSIKSVENTKYLDTKLKTSLTYDVEGDCMPGRAAPVSYYDGVGARVIRTGLRDLHGAPSLIAGDGHPGSSHDHLQRKMFWSKMEAAYIYITVHRHRRHYLVSVVNPAAGHRHTAAPELTVKSGLLAHSNLHLLWWVEKLYRRLFKRQKTSLNLINTTTPDALFTQ